MGGMVISYGSKVFQKSVWLHRCSPSALPRRLHAAQIDVELCEDVANDARRRSMGLKLKKRKLPPLRIELKTSGLLNE